MSRLPAFDRASQAREQTILAAEKNSPPSRTRVMAKVVVGMLVLHVVAVGVVLALAVSAGAEVDARNASLQWAFPKSKPMPEVVPVLAEVSSPAPVNAVSHPGTWASAHHKDQPAPWRIDANGNPVFR